MWRSKARTGGGTPCRPPADASPCDGAGEGGRARLLYMVSAVRGGLADYALEELAALQACPVDVTVLCPPAFADRLGEGFDVRPVLADPPGDAGSRRSKLRRAAGFGLFMVERHRVLARVIRQEGSTHVLLPYAEYFAPLWYRPLRRLADRGVTFGALLHDPVRDTVLGPAWWHRWSVACSSTFLRHLFVHDDDVSGSAVAVPGIGVTAVPHGPYRFPEPAVDRAATRDRWGVPEDAPLLLAFGNIRNGKNLDLVLEAMRHVPEVWLLVAGREQSGRDRPAAHYRALADAVGVAPRCRWDTRHVPEDEVGTFFDAADVVLLTYQSSFRSASSVLNIAVQFEKPCLATSGPSPLKRAVEEYGLGVWCEPDDVQAIVDGLRQLAERPPRPDWERYRRENSWEANARTVVATMFPGTVERTPARALT